MKDRWRVIVLQMVALFACVVLSQSASNHDTLEDEALRENKLVVGENTPIPGTREAKLKVMRDVFEIVRNIPKKKKLLKRQGRMFTSYLTSGLFSTIGEFFAEEASATEIEEFIAEMQELAAIIEDNDAEQGNAVSADEGEDSEGSMLWDVISGAAILRMFDDARVTFTELAAENAWVEATGPLINSITTGRIANVLNPQTLRAYLRGEASEDDTEVMQFVTVLAAQTYEFPPRCNTSTIYTNRFDSGSCIRLSDCVLFEEGGESFGTCGLGTGACCVFHSTCDSKSSQWISHFTNPDDIEAGPGFGACRHTVEPRHQNVCQYRLDFVEFRIAGPNGDSVCEHDFIEIFGGSDVPKLCGDLTGQHLYVTVPRENFLQMAVYTSGRASKLRRWNIKVTQINCDSLDLAPAGCLQYHNSTEGAVQSFNFEQRTSLREKKSHQVAANYGVCINALPDYCAVIWEEKGNYAFTVSGDGTQESSRLRSGTGIDTCDGDHIIIPGAVFRDPNSRKLMEESKFCGTKLPKIVTNTQPYILRVVTNKNEYNDEGNGGFNLKFKQVKCSDNN